MSAKALYDAGFTDLVSVIPPDAPLSPNSKVDPSQRGKCPGKKGQNGWFGYDFLRQPLTKYEVGRLEDWGANVGLLAAKYPALDIDVDDEELATEIADAALTFLGPAPIRTSRKPRLLLVYRTKEPFARRALELLDGEKKHVVEFLGEGRQYLVHGKHPSGSDYGWPKGALWDWKPAELPEITAEQADAFLAHLAERFSGRFNIGITGQREKSDEPIPPQEGLKAPSLDDLRAVVAEIPNNDLLFPTREDYIAFGHAVKAAGGDEALDIYQEWCARWDGGDNDPEVVEADWSRMQPPYRIGWDWLRTKAGDTAQDEFTPDPTLLPPEEAQPQVEFSDEYFIHRILPELKERIRYVPGPTNGTWWTWEGHRWVEDKSLQHERIVRDLLRVEALRINRYGGAKAEEQNAKSAARRIQSSNGIAAIVKLLRARVASAVDDFDRDPWVLNTPSGLIDLKVFKRRPAVPMDLVSKATSVAPAPGAAPLWSAFLERLTGGDKELEKFLQRYLGYCLTGDMSEKVLAFAWGSNTDTGKSTFVRTVKAVLGNYVKTTNVQAFMTSSRGTVPDHIAQLLGVRLTTATEPGQGQEWDDEMLKAIIGDDEIQVRRFFGSWFDFRPQFKILIAGNHEPELRQVTDSMRRRILIIPMNNKVPVEEQIAGLGEKMVAEEGPAILAWMIAGCKAWQEKGLAAPEAVRVTTERYWLQQDNLKRWVEEQCELDPDALTPRQPLYASWAQWCRANGIRVDSETVFKQELDARSGEFGIRNVRFMDGGKKIRGYKGIHVRDDMEVVI